MVESVAGLHPGRALALLWPMPAEFACDDQWSRRACVTVLAKSAKPVPTRGQPGWARLAELGIIFGMHVRRTWLRCAGAAGLALALPGCFRATGGASTSPPAAAPPPPAGPAAPPLITRVRALGLAHRPGPLGLYFDPAHAARAENLHALVAEAMGWYREKLGVEGGLTLVVMPRERWEALGVAQPYGIPGVGVSGVAGEPPVIFMPATDDGLAATDALALQPRVRPATLQTLRAAGYDYALAAHRHVDLIGLHELGHVFVRRFGIQPPNLWLDELLSTYFAHAFLAARHPAQATMFGGVLQAYIDAVQPAHRSLEDFERLYFRVGSLNYVWYQAQFHRRVVELHAAQGLAALEPMRAAFGLPRPVRPAPVALLAELEPLAPGFQAWAAVLELGLEPGR